MCENSDLTQRQADLSVLMSVYIKEKPEYLRECFESILQQTVKE